MLRIRTALAVLTDGPLLWSAAAAHVRSDTAVDCNETLVTLVGTPGAQPAALHRAHDVLLSPY